MLDLRMGSLARSPVTVLVVEDDDDMRELLVDTLERDGYFVLAADSATEAATYLHTGDHHDRKIDLIISDVRMSGPSGIDFGHELRETKSRTSTPLILMTAFPEPSVHRAASMMNAVVLAKPFRLDVLRREVLTRIAAHLKELEVEERT